MKNELTTGDRVFARVADGIYPFEFYGWWDDARKVCTLLVPHNGLTVFAHIDDIVARRGEDNIVQVSPVGLRRAGKNIRSA